MLYSYSQEPETRFVLGLALILVDYVFVHYSTKTVPWLVSISTTLAGLLE